MHSNSLAVTSTQQATHKDLLAIVRKHVECENQSPVPLREREIFIQVDERIKQQPQKIILDSGCGTGESSFRLAAQYSDHWVVAIDKSQHRLDRSHVNGVVPENLIFVCSNLVYFWRLALQAKWPVEKNYLLYPNPWPKPAHLQRRWHGHAIFPELMELSEEICLRTNWKVYAQEFALAAGYIKSASFNVGEIDVHGAMTAHERKYQQSGHRYKV